MKKEQSKNPRIAIGPLVGEYGGTTQHVRSIMKYSGYQLTPIIPSTFSFYYSKNRIKGYIRSGIKKFGFDGFDPYGMLLSKILLPRFDIVHLHGHPYWPAIYLKPKHRHVKYVHTVHQIYLEEDCYTAGEWKAKQRLNKLMFESCKTSDVVISVAKWQQELLQKKGIDSFYIPNGVDLEICENADPIRFRSKYGITGEFYYFLGDTRWYKRPKLFLELARRILGRTFIMTGNGVTKKNLQQQFGMFIPKNILCLGPIPHLDYVDALSACRVSILTSKNDTCPTALLEAMACKKVVVAANNAGPKEIVTQGKDGLLFEPDNVEDLYEKVLNAWNNPEVGINAYSKVKAEYDWKVIIERLDTLYMELHNK
jgi:glycosyltransferase involved in cell wall biosynthesis